jgi:hypothetical protein
MGMIDNLAVQLQEWLVKTNWVTLHFVYPYAMSGGHFSTKGSTVR